MYLTLFPTAHELLCIAMGFTAGLSVAAIICVFAEAKHVLNAPQTFMREILEGMNKKHDAGQLGTNESQKS